MAEVVKEKLSGLNIPTVYPGYFEDTYVVPLACRGTRLILTIMVDPETGEVLKSRKVPDFRQTEEPPKRPVRPEITNEKALEVVKAELKRGLKVGVIYRSPTEWYMVEVRDEAGRSVATVRSDSSWV
ncbi:MAG: hypothetical protein DRQ24_02555 [Candidatus Latescibacterota bacterium]|nr:MAG: hypothetical protein DRQ24_02555 [Candidatus Latescibacterota bacterium]